MSRIDFRVGKILSAKHHPDADTLFVEESKKICRKICVCVLGCTPDMNIVREGNGV